MKQVLASFAMVTVLAGCATSGAPVPSSSPQPVAATNDEPRLGTLAPRKFAAGECGMFLWSKSAERNLVFVNTRGGVGRVVIGGREVEATRVSAEGTEVLGQFETQTFKVDRLLIEMKVQFERRPGLARGAVIPQGALRVKRDDGWEYVLPVGGLVGCDEK